MMLKTSAAAVCTTCSVSSPSLTSSPGSPLSARYARRAPTKPLLPHRTGSHSSHSHIPSRTRLSDAWSVRCASTKSGQPGGTSDAEAAAPPTWPRSAHPTPYEVFDMHKGSPYTKRRFYELVKLYHPDSHDLRARDTSSSQSSSPSSSATCSSSPRNMPQAMCLERYHLIIAANELLSDPAKRRLYDTHGIGWIHGRHTSSLREADRSWRHQPNSAARNATWEDWEQWYETRDGRRREPTYMRNGTFASLVVLMCMFGAMTQANRAEASGAQFVEFTQQRHAAIGQEMLRNSMESAGRSKGERVDCFLRERESIAQEHSPPSKCSPSQHDRPA